MGRVGTFSTTLQRKGLGKGGKKERERGDEILKDFHSQLSQRTTQDLEQTQTSHLALANWTVRATLSEYAV